MFIYNIEGIARKLKIDFEGITDKISHKVTKGSAREELLKRYLRKLLPTKYSISSGTIVDSNQNESKQQDFIIYDSFTCPNFFETESDIVLPIESVYGTIEIKSSLNKSTLKQCVENIKSVRKLQKSTPLTMQKNEIDKHYPLGFVFAYSADTSLETLQTNLFEFNKNVKKEHQISIICVLDKGLIFNVLKENITEYTVIPKVNTLIGRSDSGIENSLYSFYLLLLQYLDTVNIMTPNLIEYAKKNDAFNISLNIPKELIPDDTVIGPEGFGIKYGDAMKLADLLRQVNCLNLKGKKLEELSDYFKYDYFEETNPSIKMIEISKKPIDVCGYELTLEEYRDFEKLSKKYDKDKKFKMEFDTIVKKIFEHLKNTEI